jgi:RNA polymerase-binding transcription factor DksA
MSNLEHNSNGLCNVRTARRRIDAPTIGAWVGYEEKINPKRLAAIPWASSCIVCQEAVEKTPRSEIDITLVMAA